MDGKNVSVKRQTGNVVLLKIQAKKFSFGAEGFDEHRDLLVRIDEVDGAPEAETEEP